MKSATLSSYWKAYRSLDDTVKRSVKKAYRPWEQNPFHPSLQFKCINDEEHIWAVRITIGILEGDTVMWFWVGNHDAYQRFFLS